MICRPQWLPKSDEISFYSLNVTQYNFCLRKPQQSSALHKTHSPTSGLWNYVPVMSYVYIFPPFVQHEGMMGFATTDAFTDYRCVHTLKSNLQTLFWVIKAFSTVHCVPMWNIISLIFSGWTFDYLYTITFILAENRVGKTLGYNRGVNNEKVITVMLDNFLFSWTPSFSSLYLAQIKRALLVEHPIAWEQVWNESGVIWETEIKFYSKARSVQILVTNQPVTYSEQEDE